MAIYKHHLHFKQYISLCPGNIEDNSNPITENFFWVLEHHVHSIKEDNNHITAKLCSSTSYILDKCLKEWGIYNTTLSSHRR